MKPQIKDIDSGSPAQRAGIQVGERLVSINGHAIQDVLDYKFYGYDPELTLVLEAADGGQRTLSLSKEEGEDMGLSFETYLMDRARSCANRCLFCFVDQLPPGMRETLYFKDDDARLSFLMGNYITLTNLSEREAQRIVDLHISPINVSVHATDPELRSYLLGNRNGGRGIELMRRFASAGIEMNCQIVACPGINDGPALQKSMEDLEAMYPGVRSVSIVPVGLTRYREGLPKLTPYNRETAAATVDMVEAFAQGCLARHGTRIFFCSDELYLKAGRELPPDEFYESYIQLENGVGLLRLLETEFRAALNLIPTAAPTPFSLATGVAAAPLFTNLLHMAQERYGIIKGTIFPIQNDFFGHSIDVAGLITGQDLIAQLRGKDLGQRLLIPQNMLRHGEGVFLDDVTVDQVEAALGVPVTVVAQDGFELADAMLQTGGE